MRNLNIFRKTAAVAAVLAGTFIYAQSVIIVDNNTVQPGVQNNLQTAVNAAPAGSIIYIQPSPTSYGEVNISKKLTLVGARHSSNDLKTMVGSIVLNDGAKDTTIKGLEISSSVRLGSGLTLMENITIKECRINGLTLYYSGNEKVKNWVIEGNVIASLGTYVVEDFILKNNLFTGGLSFYRSSPSILLTQNIFLGNDTINFSDSGQGNKLTISNSIFITNSRSYGNQGRSITGRVDIQNSLTYNYGSTGVYNFQQDNSDGYTTQFTGMKLNQDPKFVYVNPSQSPANQDAYSIANNSELNFTSDNLKLQASSPAKGAGISGEDLGIYQNYDFRNIGNPFGIPTIKIDNFSSSVPAGSNLTVTVTAKAQ